MFSAFHQACTELAGEYSALLERSKFADLALPCFRLSKEPVTKAQELADLYQTKLKPGSLIKTVSASGPYVNFYINEELFTKLVLRTILKQRSHYGSGTKKREKVVLEHTSINPSGPVHVGRLRNSIIGDCLSRILQFNGYKLEKH